MSSTTYGEAIAVTYVLDWMIFVVLALFGWVCLVLIARAVIHRVTRAWSRAQHTSSELMCCVRRRRSGRSIVIPPPRDQPVAFMPRGGWM